MHSAPRRRSTACSLALALSATYWALGEFSFWQSTIYDAARFWLKASSFWPLVIAFTVHFIIAFTNHPFAAKSRQNVLLAGVYLPVRVISLVGLVTVPVRAPEEHRLWSGVISGYTRRDRH